MADILTDKSSHGHYALVTDASNPAAKESAKANLNLGKPESPLQKQQSVLEQIRQAQREKREHPPEQKDKPMRRRQSEEL